MATAMKKKNYKTAEILIGQPGRNIATILMMTHTHIYIQKNFIPQNSIWMQTNRIRRKKNSNALFSLMNNVELNTKL